MPSPLLSIRETDPEVAAYVTRIAERDFGGNRSAAVIYLLRAQMDGKTEIVTRPEKSVSDVKPRPRKTTVRRPRAKMGSLKNDVLSTPDPGADALCRKEGHPLKGRKSVGKKWFCGRCGEMI